MLYNATIRMLPKLIGPEQLTALAVFALVFVSHSLSPNVTSADSHWIVPQMASLLSEGHTDLNEYPELLREHKYNGIDCVDAEYRFTRPDPAQGCPPASHNYIHFPVGTAVLALPPMVAMDLVLRVAGPPLLHAWGNRLPPAIRGFLGRDYVPNYGLVEMVLASFLMGVAAAFVFLIGREFLSRRMAVLLALLFAYCTAAWSTGSRALWQHGPEMLMLAIAVYLLVKATQRPSLAPWSAVPLAFAYFIRPTGAIAVAMLGLFVFIHHREWFPKWALLGAATAAPFVAFNLALYHRPLQPYFTQQGFLEPTVRNAGRFLAAMAGQCISPSRGLFVFSPFLLFAGWGIWTAFRRNWQAPLAYYLAAILLLHWIAISAYADWTAGFCFGPRYFSDVTPIFIFFLIPVLAAFETGRAPRMAMAAFAITALIGFGIHLRGAVNWDVERWNDPDVNSARAWDWKDPQFLRGLVR
jgi:hypothetical protein